MVSNPFDPENRCSAKRLKAGMTRRASGRLVSSQWLVSRVLDDDLYSNRPATKTRTEDTVTKETKGSSFWWKFDLLDNNGNVAGGGVVLARGPAGALAHAKCLAGSCTVRLHDADSSTFDRRTPRGLREPVPETGGPAIHSAAA